MSLGLSVTRVAAAEAVELTYEVSPACPPERVFASQVEQRVGPPVVWSGTADGLRLQVVVATQPEGFAGTLNVNAGGSVSERRFESRSCEEVIAALALIAALVIDPNANTAALPALPVGRPPPSPPPEPPRPGLHVLAPLGAVLYPVPLPAALDTSPAPPAAARYALGAVVGAALGPAPVVLFGGGFGGEIEWQSLALRPSLGVAVRAARSGTTGPSSSVARFTWASLRSTGCVTTQELGWSWAVRPCWGLDFGVLAAADAPVDVPKTDTRVFVATGPVLQLRWSRDAMFFSFSAGLFANLTRPRYYVSEPRAEVHAVPLSTGLAELGLGASIP